MRVVVIVVMIVIVRVFVYCFSCGFKLGRSQCLLPFGVRVTKTFRPVCADIHAGCDRRLNLYCTSLEWEGSNGGRRKSWILPLRNRIGLFQ